MDEGRGPEAAAPPWRFTVDGGEPFAFAGLCTRKEWEDEGTRSGRWLYSCTIVTTTPNKVVAPVHDRMPAILPGPEAEAAWLGTDLERRGRGGDCGPLDAVAGWERPGEPGAEQGRQGDGGERPAAFPPTPAELFGNRSGERSGSEPWVWTVDSPALVITVQGS